MKTISYRIKNWGSRYETHETRKLKKLAWVPVPNAHDGLEYKRVAKLPDACEIYTAWNLMLQVSSRLDLPDRGTLCRDKRPLSPDDFEMMTNFPARIFERAFIVLSDPAIGWLEEITENGIESPATPGDGPGERKKVVNEQKAPPEDPPVKKNLRVQKNLAEKTKATEKVEERGKAHPTPDTLDADYALVQIPKISNYEGLKAICDPVVMAMAVSNDYEPQSWLGWVKMACKARKVHGREKADKVWRDVCEAFWGECKSGETVRNPGAALTARLRDELA